MGSADPGDAVAVRPADWPSQLSMGLAQLRRGTLAAPWPQASWLSVARRTIVLSAFVVAGATTGRFDVFVFAAFGALQMGLNEAAVPFGRLVRLIGLTTVMMAVVGFIAMALHGSWWTVPFLAVVAFVQGSTVAIGLVQRAAGIGTLAMGVIFAGINGDPVQAATWLTLGCLAQGAVWLLFWSRERDHSLRVLLANTMRTVVQMAGERAVSGGDSNRSSAEIDQTRRAIVDSGIDWSSSALEVTDAVTRLRRTAVAWRVLRDPGYGERLAVVERLRRSIRAATRGKAPAPWPPATTGPEAWEVSAQLERDLGDLDRALAAVGQDTVAPAESAQSPGTSRTPVSRAWIQPGTPEFRHGLRMALAIAVAQTASLTMTVDHSFWIPLTCVFVVKPDWAFTVTRSVARLAGNLLAVVLVPIALIGSEREAGLVLVVAVLSAVAFRYFTGNYVLGSFGIAGTVLVLDQTLNYSQDLYASRILSTVIGAAIGIIASALIPTYRAGEATQMLAQVVQGLGNWSATITQAVITPAPREASDVALLGDEERRNLIALRPAVEGALLEPRPKSDPRVLAVAMDAVERAHLALLALTFRARTTAQSAAPGLDITEEAELASQAFAEAARAAGVPEPPPLVRPVAPVLAPQSDEDAAIARQAVTLREAATDLAAATTWITRAPGKPGRGGAGA